MPEVTQQIIGLEKAIVAADFDVVVNFHALAMYSVSRYDGTSSATFGGYASRAAFESGKRPLIHTTAQIPAAPVSGDIANLPTWFALQLLTVASGHDFVGATAVYAEPAQPDTQGQLA